MVADLVGNHVSLGEIAGRTEAPAELVIEGEVDIELVIVRAVERPDRGARRAAARRGLLGAFEAETLGLPGPSGDS